jgi:hypothetical protein
MHTETLSSPQAVQSKLAGTNGDGKDDDTPVSAPCFKAIVEYWFKARIDGPMQTLSHYDETVKQLATLGGLLPAILIAAYKVFTQPTPAPRTLSLTEVLRQPATMLFALFLLTFAAFVVCLVMACSRKLKVGGPTESCEIYRLVKHAALGSLGPDEISGAVKDWGKYIDDLIKYKHRWVKWACISITLSTVWLMVLLFATSMGVI